ncbi:enoyl-CoA hydratase-related protein [Streptomyces griseocarneus]|uniref:enoyl-CoA hydratase-related protein n=1 Tax=Streptomyces griseocarneus TaxID=51201 RepID=UPI00167E37FD|nr:enoyl-CoA hydratase-related protein [Streptomyces griseocarneus]MBZ6475728.1 hydrogenase maturation protein [Streptomyces griseocarneus]GHG51118.1 hydrogenase maturation factor HoxX [Streptomyces griseocarneus]
MRILVVASAFNSLAQRVFAELGDRGHATSVAVVDGPRALCAAVRRHWPDLVVAPMLTTAIPREVFSRHTCLVVHPGPPGDRGPASLDRALMDGEVRWGVTVLQAEEELDAGPVWASAGFAVPPDVTKSELYRGEVADAAVSALLLAVERFGSGSWTPRAQTEFPVRTRPWLPQGERRIDWAAQPTESVLRTLRAADSRPGVRDELLGGEWFLHGGHGEDRLRGRPGEVLATRAGAICRATADGAVWIPQLRRCRSGDGAPGIRLPAVTALGDALPAVPDVPAPLELPAHRATWSDIRYTERGEVGFVRFRFPGGAMSAVQCRRLLNAYRFACRRPTSVIVLGGERDFFSNGIDLNVIEAAADPAEESWANINAMDDLVEAVLTTTDRLVVAAVAGNAAAGGAMLALAADEVWCRAGTVLNPHYRLMGLYGSEYWTYTLPRRVGPARAATLMAEAAPVSAARARALGLVDRVVPGPAQEFAGAVTRMAADLIGECDVPLRIAVKKAARERDESLKPLAAYRAEELERMRAVFFSPDAPYHALRSAFVRKRPPGDAAERFDALSRLPRQDMHIAGKEAVCEF